MLHLDMKPSGAPNQPTHFMGFLIWGDLLFVSFFFCCTIKNNTDSDICLSPQSMRSQTEMELKMFRLDESAYHAMRDAALKK